MADRDSKQDNRFAPLLSAVERYYTSKIDNHGPSARGVDWACALTQRLRFVKLLKLCQFERPFSLNDLGCGYGALLAFLGERHRETKIDYLGIDISPAMISAAKRKWRNPSAQFMVSPGRIRTADYSVASGLFNVKLDQPVALWSEYVAQTLTNLANTSRRGFAVNFLMPLSPDVVGSAELYRESPQTWMAFCETEFGANVELIRDYGLREYTLLVRI